jgi:hypothetical protein
LDDFCAIYPPASFGRHFKKTIKIKLKDVKYSKPRKCKQTTKNRECKSIAIFQNALKPGKLQLLWDKKNTLA